ERHHPPVHDGPDPAARRAEAHAGEHGLGDRREPHARGPELLHGIAGEVGAHRDDAGVAPHLLRHGLLESLLKGDLAHRPLLVAYSANMSTSRSFGSGNGLASAKATASARSFFTRCRIASISDSESARSASVCCARRAMGSRAFQPAISSAGRVSAGTAARIAWKCQR